MLLYGAELTWEGSKKMKKEVQLLTNKMGRASLGVRQTTPRGIVMAESGLTPARALLNHRQAQFALRLMARPDNGGCQEEILEKKSSLIARIKERCGLRRRDTAAVQVWEEFRHLEGEIVLDRKEDALKTATE